MADRNDYHVVEAEGLKIGRDASVEVKHFVYGVDLMLVCAVFCYGRIDMHRVL